MSAAVFLRGCALPQAWAGQPQWRILDTGFGEGQRFLAAWHAWQQDPQRSAMLHFVAFDAQPVTPQQLLDGAAPWPELVPLAQQLAAQWRGLLPGFHRLAFEEGRVLLTLCVGETRALLREQDFSADAIFLGEAVAPGEAPAWDLHALKALARLCRRGTTLSASHEVAALPQDLAQCGFVVSHDAPATGDTPGLQAVYAPKWEPKGQRPAQRAGAGHCVVIGGGLAGAAAASSLARRGWQVQVLDAAPGPASGASSLPAGLLAPHQSPDDSLLSRLTRAGVRITLQQARALLRESQDWQPSGALEHRADALQALPAQPDKALQAWSRPADAQHKQLAGLDDNAPALWHALAAWIKPAALVRAWLAQPGITWRGSVQVGQILADADGWQLLGTDGTELARASLVVVAAAHASKALLPFPLTLQPVRGQVSWAHHAADAPLPPFPAHGNGHLLAQVSMEDGLAWLCGSTFDRDDTDFTPRETDHQANLERLRALLPAAAAELSPAFAAGGVQAWTQVRCASADRRPLVGELAPGLWLSTAMGSRGLTFAALAAELIAARLHVGSPGTELEFAL